MTVTAPAVRVSTHAVTLMPVAACGALALALRAPLATTVLGLIFFGVLHNVLEIRYVAGRFASVLRAMQVGRHLTEEGLRWIARETEHMNRRQRSRYLESSEAIRQPTLLDAAI